MRILFANKRLLYPPDTGARIRTLNILRFLAEWNDVTFLCNITSDELPYLDNMRSTGVRLEGVNWEEVPRLSRKFGRQLIRNIASSFPLTVERARDAALHQRAGELARRESFDLLVCDTLVMVPNVVGVPAERKVLFQHNVESQIFDRHAQRGGLLRRSYMALQARKMRRFEADAGQYFDAVIAVSENDRELFRKLYGWNHVHTIDTAVDVNYFKPLPAEEQDPVVLFLGSMDWMPNQDAVQYFVSKIWPLIRQVHPQAIFRIVGRNPSGAVTRLGREPGVEVLGTVPDVRPHLAAAAVVVVPLLVGGGTRIKIFEALAMQKAVVSTSIGAEGLKVSHGQHVLIADDAMEFAGAVQRLLDDRRERRRLGENGRSLVAKSFSSETVAKGFQNICNHICQSPAVRAV